ncbi:hypothetical protein BUALT_Bualt16G0115100 [Buddleja alternifolia]|uniref:Uncharacterized protein n=1 Tax=Buddleja alternifolia TaxID=168488 RepID=A0AAV6WIP1_9LAMI|nr:hypothetical protein BUALT_Bualt16G0115100 [Buddleja alternifolia]
MADDDNWTAASSSSSSILILILGVVFGVASSSDSSEPDPDSDNLPLPLTPTDIGEWRPTSPVDKEVVEKPLYVTRTDYALKYTSAKTGEVLWYLMFVDIEALFQCEGIESFLGNKLDTKLPMHCQTGPVVYRIRDRSSLESLFIDDRLKDALPGGGVLSLPASSEHAMELMNNLLAPHNINEKEKLLALPSSWQCRSSNQ